MQSREKINSNKTEANTVNECQKNYDNNVEKGKHLPITQGTESERFKFLNEAANYIYEQRQNGNIVYDFMSAAPLQNPPKEVLDILRKNITNKKIKNYPESGSGINKCLVESYIKWYEAFHGCSITENNIIRNNNSFNIIKDILMILDLKKNNKKLLMHAPIFGYFQSICNEIGVNTQIVNTDDSGCTEGINLYNALNENNVGAILFNSPVNPTGEIMSKEYKKE
ncbi:aminotransferase class I/II-fold pyridoxal phosphate-dependent enzyme [Flavobacteriaceae bacterium]|nr:aminotransferase class I/II-fold pyridoxal phosphate-dependent enzyme [Flavobacteriaceae bacterium]